MTTATGNDSADPVLPPVVVGRNATTVQLEKKRTTIILLLLIWADIGRYFYIVISYAFLKIVPRSGHRPIVSVKSYGPQHLLFHGRLHPLAEHVTQNPSDEHHDEYYEQYDEVLQQYRREMSTKCDLNVI